MRHRELRVTLQGRKLSVPVRRDRRARRITIHIDAGIGGARIVMPVDVSLSEAASAVRKHEDWPGLAKITAIREAEGRGQRRISILCGNGGIFLPEELARGADGAMTGFGYPEMMVAVTALAAQGDLARAQDVFDAYLPLVRYEQQPGAGLAVRKHVLARRGVIATPTIRRPGRGLSAEAREEVDRLVSRQERRLDAVG